MDTQGQEYADRLVGKPAARWKRVVKRFADIGAVYERNLRRQDLGRTLDVGCGVGRNLPVLPEGSLGVDHNAWSVEEAHRRGLDAMTTEEFLASGDIAKPSFDGMLLAHVIEHMPPDKGREVVATYLPYLRPGGKVLFVCPQERGYASDPTHVRWTTGSTSLRASPARSARRTKGGAGRGTSRRASSSPSPASGDAPGR